MSARIAINGRFRAQRTTGVQRYAREMVRALDELDMPDVELELICPPGAERLPGLRHIRQSEPDLSLAERLGLRGQSSSQMTSNSSSARMVAT